MIIQEEVSTERISCIFAIKYHRDSLIDLFGQIVPTPVRGEWKYPADSQSEGNSATEGLVKHDEMHVFVQLTTDT